MGRTVKLLTKAILAKLPPLYATEATPLLDKVAVVKFFNPVGAGTWYGIEFDAADGDTFFGFVTGLGDDELGYFSLAELASIKLRFGMGIERDIAFSPKKLRDIPETAAAIGLSMAKSHTREENL